MSWTHRGAFAAALVALLPAGALADYGLVQTAGSYQTPAGATQVCQSCTGSYTVNLPFTFKLYGKDYKSVTFASFGMLAFEGGGSASNVGIPSASTPNAFIAPWWAGTSNGNMRYATSGEAPNRKIVFEWAAFLAASDSTWQTPDENSMTVALYESSNKIEIRYVRVAKNQRNGFSKASLGIESWDGSEGVNLIACSSAGNCANNQFPDGQIFRLTPGKDAAVDSFTINNGATCTADAGVPCSYAGATSAITTKLRNLGGDSFTGAKVSYYISTDATFSGDDVYMGQSGPSPRIDKGGTADVSGQASFPDFPPGQYWLIGVIDGVVDESDFGNNVFVNPVPLTLRSPGPNVIVSNFITVPLKLAHGSTGNNIVIELKNTGILPAIDPAVAVVLSSNQILSMQDPAVFDGKVTLELAPGESKQVPLNLKVPDGMPNDATPGIGLPEDPYTLGVIIDPHDQVAETNELDNTFQGPGSGVKVGGGALSIVSTELPDGGLGSPYGVQLLLAGGDGVITWSMTGAPGGLSVDSVGYLHGSPGQSGDFPVSFTVTDAKGGTATKMLTLHVDATPLPLRVVTSELPQASFGVPYEAQLRASGGCGPYSWTLQPASEVPAGLSLSPTGLLSGTPRQAGENFRIDVTVADSCQGAEDLSTKLVITEPPKITIAEIALPPVTVGKNYTANLHAAGGVVRNDQEYEWQVLQTVRLPLGPGDTTEYLTPGDAPPGLAVLLNGTVTGNATKAGSYLMTVRVQDQASPKRGTDEATILVRVVYDAGMSIVTLTLPDAAINQPYSAAITANGGVGDLEWTIIGDTGLPPGLALDPPTGRITGSPATNAVESGEDDHIWAFLVYVKDSQNRTAQQALAIRVALKAPQPLVTVKKVKTGCDVSAGGFSALGLLAAAALLRRRRP